MNLYEKREDFQELVNKSAQKVEQFLRDYSDNKVIPMTLPQRELIFYMNVGICKVKIGNIKKVIVSEIDEQIMNDFKERLIEELLNYKIICRPNIADCQTIHFNILQFS